MMRFSAIQWGESTSYLPITQRTEAHMIDYMVAVALQQSSEHGRRERRRRQWTLESGDDTRAPRMKHRFPWWPVA
jgi:hypothetical protein